MVVEIPQLATMVDSQWVNSSGQNITEATGLTFFSEIINQTAIFNVTWIFGVIIFILTLAVITRDINKWKILAFPIAVGWHIVGLKQPLLLLISTAIIFTIEVVSLETLGSILSAVSGAVTTTVKKGVPLAVFEGRRKKLKKQYQMFKTPDEPLTRAELKLDRLKETKELSLEREKHKKKTTIEGADYIDKLTRARESDVLKLRDEFERKKKKARDLASKRYKKEQLDLAKTKNVIFQKGIVPDKKKARVQSMIDATKGKRLIEVWDPGENAFVWRFAD